MQVLSLIWGVLALFGTLMESSASLRGIRLDHHAVCHHRRHDFLGSARTITRGTEGHEYGRSRLLRPRGTRGDGQIGFGYREVKTVYRVCRVCRVCLVCLVYLVRMVCLVYSSLITHHSSRFTLHA